MESARAPEAGRVCGGRPTGLSLGAGRSGEDGAARSPLSCARICQKKSRAQVTRSIVPIRLGGPSLRCHVLQSRSHVESSADMQVVPGQAPGASRGRGPLKDREAAPREHAGWSLGVGGAGCCCAWDDPRTGPCGVGPAATGTDKARPWGGRAGAGRSFPRQLALGPLHQGASRNQAACGPRLSPGFRPLRNCKNCTESF